MAEEEFVFGGATLLQSPFVVTLLLPFILVFTIVFAILQKSKIFGEGKRQIDVLVALAIALMAIAFQGAVAIIVQLAPFVAVALVIILVLMLLLGSFTNSGDLDKIVPKWLKITLTILAVCGVAIAVLYITGFWQIIYDYAFGRGSGTVINIIMIAVLIGAVVAVIVGSGKSTNSSK